MARALELALHTVAARPLSTDDAERLQALLVRCRAYFRQADGRVPGKHAALERLSDALGDEHARLFGFTAPGDPGLCGILELRLHEPQPREVTIVLLLLAPEVRRQGLGREIVEGVAQMLAAAGYRSMHLGVQGHEAAARAFWSGLGFLPEGRERGVTRYVRPL